MAEGTEILDADRKTDPLRSTRKSIRTNKLRPSLAHEAQTSSTMTAAATRQNAQLPAFAPLLEELEVAGWSAHRRSLSGNFHDWMLLERRTLLIMSGHVTGGDGVDSVEAALVAQGAWAAIRSHAHHATDAGVLLSLAGQSLWPIAGAGMHSSVAVSLVDLDGGQASVAAAGECLALKIRATGIEQLSANQPAVGAERDFTYSSQLVQLSLRDRIVLVADEPAQRPAKLASKITASFSRLDAESHRRMMAADAVALVRDTYDQQADDGKRLSASIVAVRRR